MIKSKVVDLGKYRNGELENEIISFIKDDQGMWSEVGSDSIKFSDISYLVHTYEGKLEIDNLVLDSKEFRKIYPVPKIKYIRGLLLKDQKVLPFRKNEYKIELDSLIFQFTNENKIKAFWVHETLVISNKYPLLPASNEMKYLQDKALDIFAGYQTAPYNRYISKSRSIFTEKDPCFIVDNVGDILNIYPFNRLLCSDSFMIVWEVNLLSCIIIGVLDPRNLQRRP